MSTDFTRKNSTGYNRYDFLGLIEKKMVQAIIYFSILNLAFIFFGSGILRADNSNVRCTSIEAPQAEIVSNPYLSDTSFDKALKNKTEKDLAELVQVARGISGRTDITAVRPYVDILEQSDNPKNSRGSITLTGDNFASLAQNTKRLNSPDNLSNQTHHGYILDLNKRITETPPTYNGLSFTREYLETKK